MVKTTVGRGKKEVVWNNVFRAREESGKERYMKTYNLEKRSVKGWIYQTEKRDK